MKKNVSGKRSITVFLAIALLVVVVLNNANSERRPSLMQDFAVIGGDHAVIRVMPSRYAGSIGVCWRGQRITLWMPPVFGFHRASCNGIDGFIASERIVLRK